MMKALNLQFLNPQWRIPPLLLLQLLHHPHHQILRLPLLLLGPLHLPLFLPHLLKILHWMPM
jgi:hypothetical protein